MNEKAKEYSSQKHLIATTHIFYAPLILFLLIIIGIPTYLKILVESLNLNGLASLIIFAMIFSVIYYVLNLPIEYYAGFLLEHRYGLSNQKPLDWVKREIKKSIVLWIINAPLVIALFFFIKHFIIYWWLFTGTLWFFVSMLVSKFGPILIVPIFYEYLPIKNPSLKEKLLRLAARVDFSIKDVYGLNISKDTKKANAALLGLGKQKRIVLCDTLLENFNESEIESVMGHELGHHKLKHTLKLILFGGSSSLIVFYITNLIFLELHNFFRYTYLYDLDSLVLVFAVMAILNIFIIPIQNAFSRSLEKEADEFAIKITDDKNSFISTMEKLQEQNLSGPRPNKFYEIMLYNHPPISRRIDFAKSFGAKK